MIIDTSSAENSVGGLSLFFTCQPLFPCHSPCVLGVYQAPCNELGAILTCLNTIYVSLSSICVLQLVETSISGSWDRDRKL